jgi:hypothetical protein
MHGDVEQEASTKIVNFIILGVEVLPPRAGPNMMCRVCSHLNIFNTLIATTPNSFQI